MKTNKKNLILTLLTVSLLTSCNDNTNVQNGSNAIGNADNNNTNLNLQSFYETLKTASGGTKAMETLLDRMIELEYADGVKNGFAERNSDDTYNVKSYRTAAKFQEDINEYFQDIVDGTSYLDDNGDFDANLYKDAIVDLDYEIDETKKTGSTLISDATLNATLVYDYDAYIEDVVIPNIYETYFYEDYVMSTNKYKGQFANQYAMSFDVLKIDNYTTALNSAWTEALIRDVKAVTTNANAETGFAFNAGKYKGYNFATFNSKGQLIEFKAADNELAYTVYADATGSTKIAELKDKLYNREIEKLNADDGNVIAATEDATTVDSWTITSTSIPDETFFAQIEDVLIARKLFNIDQEVIMARNYDFKNAYYNAYTETEKTQASSYADTYSSSGTKSIAEGAKASKITAQQTKYYTKEDTYTKGTYTNVLPTAISSLRGTTARELLINLSEYNGENYLLPKKEGNDSPVYLDSTYYYVCKVSNWYGLYLVEDGKKITDRTAVTKTDSSYQINAYQTGSYVEWNYDSASSTFKESEEKATKDNKDIINLVQTSAASILTSSMRTEAVVELLEKYNVVINDQEVYDYIKSQYPAYFDED